MPKSKELDQFYTNPDYAKVFLDKVDQHLGLDNFDRIIEPSAGTGSFFNLLDKNKRVGLDLEPKADGVIKMDFFDFDYNQYRGEKILTLGNPPFGKNASLAQKFFNRSAIYSDAIAFLIPRTFRKASMINRLDRNFHCIFDETVPENQFVFENKPYDVWCAGQIWQKKENKRDKIKIYKLNDVKDFFEIVSPAQSEFAIQRVGGGAGTIKTENYKSFSPLSHYFIKPKHPQVLDIFKECDFESVKYDTAGNPSVAPTELVSMFIGKIHEKNIKYPSFSRLFDYRNGE